MLQVTATVVQIDSIDDELLRTVNRWFALRGVAGEATRDWLQLTCEDGEAFVPTEQLLVLGIPPSDISVGATICYEEAEPAGVELPRMDDEGAVPRALAFGTEISNREGLWIASCPPAEAGPDLFVVDAVEALAAMTKSIRLMTSNLALCAHGSGQVGVFGSIPTIPLLAYGWLPASVNQPTEVLSIASPLGLRIRGDQPVKFAWAPPSALAVTDQWGDARVQIGPPVELPEPLPSAYFSDQAVGTVHVIRFFRPGGLGHSALKLAAESRRSGRVTFTVDSGGCLQIDAHLSDVSAARVEGPGFTTRDGVRDVPVTVPHQVAQALVRAAERGAVLEVDDRVGRLHLPDTVTVEWSRS